MKTKEENFTMQDYEMLKFTGERCCKCGALFDRVRFMRDGKKYCGACYEKEYRDKET
jgi:formylmethanofuran dehydrogenase subunit E